MAFGAFSTATVFIVFPFRQSSARWVPDRDVRQVAVLLVQVEPVSDDELRPDREAEELDRDVPVLREVLLEQRGDPHGPRLPRREEIEDLPERQPRVDDVLEQQDVLSGDVHREVADQLDVPARAGAGVGADLQEVDDDGGLEPLEEVGEEEDRPFEDDHGGDLTSLVAAVDLQGQLAQTHLNPLFGKQHSVDHGRNYNPPS